MSEVKNIKINGITYSVNPDMFNGNYELIELLDEIEDNPIRYPRFVKMITGDKYEETKEALRDKETGLITNVAMREFTEEFAKKVASLKN